MALTSVKIILLCVIGIAVTEVTCDSVQIKDLKIENKPNDYFGEILSEVKPQGNESSISVTVPIKKDLDENLQATLSLTINGIPFLKDHVINFCETLKNDGLLKPLIGKIQPQLPSKCPIPAGDWKITDYVINPKDFFPIIPSGDFELKLDIGLPDAEPFINVDVTGSIISSVGSMSLSSLFKLI